MRTWLLLLTCIALTAQELPLVEKVEHQRLGAQVSRVLDALKFLGEPLLNAEDSELRSLAPAAGPSSEAIKRIQTILDRHCLIGVNINPESRVKVLEGPA